MVLEPLLCVGNVPTGQCLADHGVVDPAILFQAHGVGVVVWPSTPFRAQFDAGVHALDAGHHAGRVLPVVGGRSGFGFHQTVEDLGAVGVVFGYYVVEYALFELQAGHGGAAAEQGALVVIAQACGDLLCALVELLAVRFKDGLVDGLGALQRGESALASRQIQLPIAQLVVGILGAQGILLGLFGFGGRFESFAFGLVLGFLL